MYGKVSISRQIILGAILLVIIFGVIEAAANVWLNEINSCAFEDSEIYEHLTDEEKRILCIANYNLRYTEDRISIAQEILDKPGRYDEFEPNNHGLRGPDFTTEKPNNVYRIILVGGSTTLSIGVFEDETISYYLKEKFNNSGLEFVEVINAGLASAWSKTETKLIKERLIDFDPDLFIVYDGFNDIKHGFNVWASEEQREKGNYSTQINWKDRWIEICDLGNQKGFDTIITLQPFLGTGDRLLTDQEFENFWTRAHLLNQYLETTELYAEQLYEINKHCNQTSDLRGLFDNISEPVYYDHAHVGANGNKIVADKFFELSLPLVLENRDQISNFTETTEEILYDGFENTLESNPTNFITIFKTPVVLAILLDDPDKLFPKTKQTIENNFRAQDLSGKDFSGLDLKNAIFHYANLDSVVFENANLEDADFRFAKMDNIVLKNANLKNAKLPRAEINKADLSGADFSGAYLSGIIIKNSNLDNVKFKDTNLRGVKFLNNSIDGAIFENVDLTYASLERLDFSNTQISNSKLNGVSAYLSGFDGLDFSSLNIVGTSLQPSTFSGSSIRNASFVGVDFSNVDFTGKLTVDQDIILGTILTGSDFTGANLSGGIFFSAVGATIKMINFGSPDFSSAIFFGADLSGADLSYVNFTGADLSNADLAGSNLEGAILDNAILDCVGHGICN